MWNTDFEKIRHESNIQGLLEKKESSERRKGDKKR
jgi:hypothetical protein